MSQSEHINEIAGALSKAQAAIKNAAKNSEAQITASTKRKYADLTAVWDACREALTKNDLAVTQTFCPAEIGVVTVRTVLLHKSGQWIDSLLSLPAGSTAQQYGSAATYARRYSLAAIVGVSAEDDDGEAASAAKPVQQAQARPPVTNGRVSTADRVQQHMQANGQTGPHNPEPPALPPSGEFWEGPGQCMRCHAPAGKRHGKPCADDATAQPEMAAATAAEFKRIAIERGFTDKVKLDTIQAWIEALAPDYEGRPYKQLHGRDWAYLIDAMPASATPYSDGTEDPFADTPEELAALAAREAVAV